MTDNAKPRFRGPAYSSERPNAPWDQVSAPDAVSWRPHTTGDTFNNFAANLGYGTNNLTSASGYGFNFITRNRIALEAGYRGSWIIGAAIDIPADDMTQAGIELQGLDSEDTDLMMAGIRDLGLSAQIADSVRWGRLFGGAIGMFMIDGQDTARPLNLDSIGEGQFRGIHVYDRTVVNPAYTNDLVTEQGPSFGLPKTYQTFYDGAQVSNLKIDHSRVFRQIGVPMPYYQARYEQFWGASIVERIFDRLVGFDTATAGVVQLIHKAYLRVMKVKNLRQNIATGGAMATAMAKQFDFMRQTQTIEGISLIDGDDEFEALTYAFTGLDSVLEQLGGQLCGALDLPASRLFGKTPGGLAATGEGDARNYDLANKRKQETHLRRPWTMALDILHRSVLGRPAEPGFTFVFNPLQVPTDAERATIAKTGTDAIVAASGASITSQQTSLRELRALADKTGMFGSITDEEIDAAEDVVPSPADLAALAAPADPQNADDPAQIDDEGGANPGLRVVK